MTEMKLFYETGNNKAYLALQVTRDFRLGWGGKYELSQWDNDEINIRKLLGLNFNRQKDRFVFPEGSKRIQFHIYGGNIRNLNGILKYCNKKEIPIFNISSQDKKTIPFINEKISSFYKV